MIYQEKTESRLRTSGMSIIEISVVLMIIGLMAAMAVGAYRWLGTANISATKSRLQNLKSSIETYKFDGKQYPSRLEDLLRKPADWKQGYYNPAGYVDNEGDLDDSWNVRIQYKKNPVSAGSNKRPYELYSWGPNGEGSPQEEWINIWEL
jgi:type II secretion system protein G